MSFEEFLAKMSPLKTANKLGALYYSSFLQIGRYDYAVEFRHPFGCATQTASLFNIFNVSLLQSYLHL